MKSRRRGCVQALCWAYWFGGLYLPEIAPAFFIAEAMLAVEMSSSALILENAL